MILAAREIHEILADVRTLAREYYLVAERPLGITGEIGEFEAARLLDLKLAPARAPGFDAIDPKSGRKYQVKARVLSQKDGRTNPGQKLGSIKFTHDWDAVLLVLFDATFEVTAIFEAERQRVEDELARPGSKARSRGALSVSKFKSIGRRVWPRV